MIFLLRFIIVAIYMVLAAVIWEMRYKRSFLLVFILLVCLTAAFSYFTYFHAYPLEKFLLEKIQVPVEEVVSGNQFIVKGVLQRKRTLILNRTSLPGPDPERAESKSALENLIDGRKVRIEFLPQADYSTEPWPVIGYLEGMNINYQLTSQKLLVAESISNIPDESVNEVKSQVEATQIKERVFRVWIRLPNWARYILWVFLGFLGANALSRYVVFKGQAKTMEKKVEASTNLGLFIIILMSAIYALITSLINNLNIFPPIICLILMVLLFGYFLKETREKNV